LRPFIARHDFPNPIHAFYLFLLFFFAWQQFRENADSTEKKNGADTEQIVAGAVGDPGFAEA
jgi:hypothetical protein